MAVYLVNIILILIWGLLLTYMNPTQRKKKVFCGIASLQWILVSGLRSPMLSADVAINYRRIFDYSRNLSWKRVFEGFVDFYFYDKDEVSIGGNLFATKDMGYLVFQKFIHIFTDNFQVYLFIVAVIIFASLGYFIYKNSIDPCFSYILFSVLFYSFFAVTGIRQSLATALAVLIGYEFIKQNKFWKFVIIFLVAYTLHKSVLVFLPFYFLAKIKISWKYLLSVVGVTAAALAIGSPLTLALGRLFGFDRDEVYEASTATYTFLMFLLGAVTIVFFKMIQKQGKYKDMEINATVMASAMTALTLFDQSIMRVQQYYALFLMFNIPSIYNCFDKKVKIILRIGCIGALIVLFLMQRPSYLFFWQI